MKKRYFLTALIFVLAFASAGYSQNFSKVGTAVAQFLKIPAGARGASLGGAYAAAANDVFAMAWNPAGIGHIRRPSLSGSYNNYIADLKYSFVGYAMPASRQSSFGVSAIFLTTDPIEVTTIEQPNGTGTYYDYNGFVLGLSYSQTMTDRLNVGVTLKLIRESIFREDASAVAFDIGSQFDTGIYGVRLGMCISNFGSKMRLDGPDINTTADTNPNMQGDRETPSSLQTLDWPLPMIFRMGILLDLYGGNNPNFHSEKNRLTLVVDANDPIDNNLRGNLGAEYSWNETLALRIGYHTNYDDNTLGLTFGGGLNFGYGGNEFSLDYAFQDFGLLDYVHQYSLTVYF
jgi:hypothetical protein